MWFVNWLINCHCPLLSSLADSLHLDVLLKWMRQLLPIELSSSNCQITWEDPRYNHFPVGHTPIMMMTYSFLAWRCLKQEKPLRIALCRRCQQSILLRIRSGILDWIGRLTTVWTGNLPNHVLPQQLASHCDWLHILYNYKLQHYSKMTVCCVFVTCYAV